MLGCKIHVLNRIRLNKLKLPRVLCGLSAQLSTSFSLSLPPHLERQITMSNVEGDSTLLPLSLRVDPHRLEKKIAKAKLAARSGNTSVPHVYPRASSDFVLSNCRT